MQRVIFFFLISILASINFNCPAPGVIEPSFSQLKKLVASDGAYNDRLGNSVAISGDFAIAGAANKNGAGTDYGGAYLYYRNQGGTENWGEVKKLSASDAENQDYFGYSVAINGNYALVGAYREDGGGTDRGAAYLFYRNQGDIENWGEVKKLVPGDSENGDLFGCAVSISGDYALIGSYEDSGGGAAYIFFRNHGGDDNWGEAKKLVASDAVDGDSFGWSVAIRGDYAIVGALREGSNSGAAYIFSRNLGGDDNWGEVKKIKAGVPESFAYFGYSVAIDVNYALVGADEEDGVSGINRGAAYLFYRNQGGADNWGQAKKLIASDVADEDFFGATVALSGDLACVGAPWNDGAVNGGGGVYIYNRNQGGTGNWGESQKLAAINAQSEAVFGISVAMDGEYLCAGAAGDDGTGPPGEDFGVAYILKRQ